MTIEDASDRSDRNPSVGTEPMASHPHPSGTASGLGDDAHTETRSPSVYAAALIALVTPLLMAAPLIASYWSGRYLLLLVLACLAPVLLFHSAMRAQREASAVAALLFVAWAALSTALSPHPQLALWGHFGWGTGLVYVAALASLWVIGRSCAAHDGSDLLLGALLLTASLSCVIAVVQTLVDLTEFNLEPYDGRAHGATGNPVFLAGFLAAAVALAASARLPIWARAALVGWFSVGLQLTGSRIGLVIAVVAVLAAPILIRWRILLAVVVVAGLGLGSAVAAVGGVTSGASRLFDVGVEGTSGYRARTEMWLSSRRAIVDRPLVGEGPGQFRSATIDDRTLEFVRAEGAGRLFYDAHNLVVEYAVTVGIPGVVLLLAWITLSLRGSSNAALTAFALTALAVHLVSPQNTTSTPLAFLALGASAPSRSPTSFRGARPLLAISLVIGLVLASIVGFGFFALSEARLDFTKSRGRQADRILPWWQTKEQLARIAYLRAIEEHGFGVEPPDSVVRYRQEAVERDPDNPGVLLTLADTFLQRDQPSRAEPLLLRTLEIDPWSAPAMNALARIRASEGDRREAVLLLRRSLRIVPDQPATIEYLRELREEARNGALP